MRLRLIKSTILILFIALLCGLAYLQLFQGEDYFETSRRNYIRLVPEEGIRGSIYDRNGYLLAEDYLSLNISIIPQEVEDQEKIFIQLGEILELDPQELKKTYKKQYTTPFLPVIIVEDVSQEDLVKVLERRSYLPGIFIQRIPRRNYVYENAFAHVLGYVNYINTGEFKRLKKYGFSPRDKIGYTGLEEQYDSYLRGTSGGRQIQVNNLGRQMRLLSLKTASKGKDLKTTLDARMQKIAYDALGDKPGSVVFLDPYDGQVRVMVSSPSFNPEIFNVANSGLISNLMVNKQSPFLNRAISGIYPLGSVFKIVTALAGLETGAVKPGTEFRCNGKFNLGRTIFKCWSVHGVQNIKNALVHSCNVYFYNLGNILGIDNIYKYAKLFGLGDYTGIDLPQEARGLFPNPRWKRRALKVSWYKGDTVNVSIGQGQLLITPIQAARIAAAVVNQGKLVSPFVVSDIAGIDVSKVKIEDLGLKKENLNLVEEGLKGVVKEATGTGHFAYSKEVSFAGKTGTAQASGNSHSWFAGFAPADKPELAFVVMLEHGGSGVYAARLTRAILEEFKKQDICFKE